MALGTRALFGVIIPLTATCTGSSSPPAPPADPVPVPAPEWPPLEADGPLRGLVMANGIDRRGAPVQPAMEFPPEAEQIVAIVAIGDVSAGEVLTIAWNRLIALDRRERLFEHRIDVEPFGNVSSVGVSPGLLQEGTYEVVATLGDHEVWIPWTVRVGARTPVPPSGGGATLTAVQLVAFVPRAQPQGDTETGPPEPGYVDEDGWTFDERPDADEPDEPTRCGRVSLSGSASMLDIQASARQSDADCGEVIIGARAGGSDKVVPVARGVGEAAASFEVCALPGGSDIPGSVVDLGAYSAPPETEEVNDQVELEDTGLPPLAVLVTEPSSGIVERGATIRWKLTAAQLPIAPGVRSAEVRGPGGVLAETPLREQKPCDGGRYVALLEGTYTVPDDPPPLIELTGTAKDFAGRTNTGAAFFAVEGQVWQGSLSWNAETPTGGQFLAGTIGLNVAPDGTVVGAMTAVGVAADECCGVVTYTHGCQAAGNRQGDALVLEFHTCRTDPGQYGTAWTPLTLRIVDDTAVFDQDFGAGGRVEIRLTCRSC